MDTTLQPTLWTPRPLPKLSDLHHAPEEAFKNDQLNLILNQPPNMAWIREHQYVDVKDEFGNMVKLKYIPIDKIEFLMLRIFGEWRREIKSIQQIFNSVLATVRLWARNPTTGEWMYHDGVGAVPAQTDKGKGAAELGAIKNNAIMLAGPASVSYAVKDAAECYGTIFGKNLNKSKTMIFSGSYQDVDIDQRNNGKQDTPPIIEEITTQF